MDSWDSLVSMRSNQTWDCQFKDTPTTAEILTRDDWLLIQLDNSGAPSFQKIVSLYLIKDLKYSFYYF